MRCMDFPLELIGDAVWIAVGKQSDWLVGDVQVCTRKQIFRHGDHWVEAFAPA